MGVNINSYVVYGVKVEGFDSDFSDIHDPDGPTCILDGMSGEWMVFGKMLYDSGGARYGFEDGEVFTTIDLSLLDQHEKEYRKTFEEKYPGFVHLIDKPFKLHAFLHFH